MTDRTRLVWLESPTNPLLRVVDLDAVSELVHGAGALVAVDSTFASPVLQRPLELGADLVVHSSTKYLGGHSDVLGGAVLTSDDCARGAVALPPERRRRGAVTVRLLAAAPRDEDAAASGASVSARTLLPSPGGSRDRTPWSRCTTPGSKATRDTPLPGARWAATSEAWSSFEVSSGEAARSFLERLRVFTLAESLGAVEVARREPGDDDPRVDTGGDPNPSRRQRRAAAPVRRY